MGAWEIAKLSDVCEIQRGGSPRPIESFITEAEDGINWIKIGDVAEGAKYITSTKEKIKPEGAQRSRAVQAGDFLLSNSMSFGRPYILKTSGCIHDGWLVLRYDKSKLTEDYLYHVLGSEFVYAQFLKFAVGAVVKNLNSEVVRQVSIPLPPLPEQRRIAAILDQADVLRAKRREALAELDQLTQSIFIEMFGDPVANPKGWPTSSVSQLLNRSEVFVDGDWVESKDQDPNGEVRLIQLADIGDGSYVNKSARFLTEQTSLRLRCTPLKPGDVLIARMPDPLGRACIFPGDPKKCVTVVDVCIVRPSSNGPDPVWLMCCINTPGFRNQIAGEATGTTRTRISRGNLSKLGIISPPVDLQKRFAERYRAVLDCRHTSLSSLCELDSLFSSLQHRAFRGEL